MTYHDEVYEELSDLLEPILVDQLIDALPRPLLLTEDGRFVKVEPWDPRWETPYRPEHIYRIVEVPTQ